MPEPPPLPEERKPPRQRRWVDRFLGNRPLGWVCLIVAVLTFANWFTCAGISSHLGGDALGTVPHKGRFVVTSHGSETPVDERTWVKSLYYTTATMIVSPVGFACFGIFVLQVIFGGMLNPDPGSNEKPVDPAALIAILAVLAGFLGPWYVIWSYAILRDFLMSLRAYASL